MTKIGRYVERALDRLTVTTMLLCSDSVLGFLEGRPASAGLSFCFVADFVEVVFWGCSGAVCPNVCLMLQCASDGCHSVASGCRAPAWNSFQSMPVPCLLGGRTSRTRPADYSPVRHPQPAGAMPVGDAERLAHGLWAKMTTKPFFGMSGGMAVEELLSWCVRQSIDRGTPRLRRRIIQTLEP